MQGRFISFEGIDGSGKSTQARLLADALRADGQTVTLTREPGGSTGAEEIRRLVLEGNPDRWSAETEILLFTAARRDHLEKTIRPALSRGEVVITDRFADSTRIFQGVNRGNIHLLDNIHSVDDMFSISDRTPLIDQLHDIMIGIEPDLTILIDIEPAVGLARAAQRQGKEMRFEDMGLAFQTSARDGFLALASQHDRFCIIDGARSQELVAKDVRAACNARSHV